MTVGGIVRPKMASGKVLPIIIQGKAVIASAHYHRSLIWRYYKAYALVGNLKEFFYPGSEDIGKALKMISTHTPSAAS